MTKGMSRAEYLAKKPRARAWAELDYATNQQAKITPGPIRLEAGCFAGKRALILGAGVGGLTAAYELLAQETGMQVTVLEAQNRTGGRCLSLRTGDTFTEDTDSRLFDGEPGETQTVRFEWPVGDSEPYLNAGPGRIPSAHKRLLNYLRDFGVAVEVYVMNSMSNLVYMEEGPLAHTPWAYRQIDHNLRGWLAQMVYENADVLLAETRPAVAEGERADMAEKLRSLMVTFGELDVDGRYAPTAGEDGFENAIDRAGFMILPGVSAGKIAEAIKLDDLLASEYWKATRFYQPVDFLWQPTLFQPVGGMDQVERAFARQVAVLGGTVHLNSPVKSIDWDSQKCEFIVQVAKLGTEETVEYRADYCLSNMAMPFLEKILSEKLLSERHGIGLSTPFKDGLQAVFAAQNRPDFDAEGTFQGKFLATTTKVGWQGERTLWQGAQITERYHANRQMTALQVPDSEEGVVPIFGGISWTSHEITQIWYPSTGYHDQLGVLTGTYNFGEIAYDWGGKSVQDRLAMARQGAAQFSAKFGAGLEHGVAIAWQNMPYIKGGWADWHTVGDPDTAAEHFNELAQGSGIYDGLGAPLSDPVFFVVGDQLSSLPGWQEGAIAAALNALTRMARPDLTIPYLKHLPDTRLMVEGI